eukprot:12146-Heterococcus_DN1.PRE.3
MINTTAQCSRCQYYRARSQRLRLNSPRCYCSSSTPSNIAPMQNYCHSTTSASVHCLHSHSVNPPTVKHCNHQHTAPHVPLAMLPHAVLQKYNRLWNAYCYY